jgi:hypothetical protein
MITMSIFFADLESFFSHLNSGTLIFWGAVVIMSIVPTISWCVVHWHKHEIDAQLKHEMIARGMSADEIERILSAKSAPTGKL